MYVTLGSTRVSVIYNTIYRDEHNMLLCNFKFTNVMRQPNNCTTIGVLCIKMNRV